MLLILLFSQETGYAAPDYDDAQPAYGGDQDVYQVSGETGGGPGAFYGHHYAALYSTHPSTLPQYTLLPTHCLGASNSEKPLGIDARV